MCGGIQISTMFRLILLQWTARKSSDYPHRTEVRWSLSFCLPTAVRTSMEYGHMFHKARDALLMSPRFECLFLRKINSSMDLREPA